MHLNFIAPILSFRGLFAASRCLIVMSQKRSPEEDVHVSREPKWVEREDNSVVERD